MSYLNPWQSYRQISTHTAPPGQLVAMLYDGAIRFLEQALAGFSNEDPLEFNQTINNNVLRAQSILAELNNSLDLERGGKLADTLRQLYLYMDSRLTRSNLAKEPAGIEDALSRLRTLREAWQKMLGQHYGSSTESRLNSLSAFV